MSDPLSELSAKATEGAFGPMGGGKTPKGNSDAARAAWLLEMFAPTMFQSFQVLYALTITFCDWFAVTLEVFTRRDFGERYLNPIKLFMAASMMGFVVWFGSLLISFTRPNSWNPLLTFVWFAFLGLAVWHLIRIWQRNQQGGLWHSRSFGVSRFGRIFTTFSDWTLYRVVEPVVCYGLGVFLLVLSPALGAWLMVASSAMFIKNNLMYLSERGKLLDLIDARIQMGYMSAALDGAPKQATRGYTVVSIPKLMQPELKAIADAAASAPLDFSNLIATQLGRTPVPPPAAETSTATTPDFSELIATHLNRSSAGDGKNGDHDKEAL